jgi:hypothetical protein
MRSHSSLAFLKFRITPTRQAGDPFHEIRARFREHFHGATHDLKHLLRIAAFMPLRRRYDRSLEQVEAPE